MPRPIVLTKIDELIRDDHSYLSAADECYFLREYTARQGYAYSDTNQLILNFKKSLEVKATGQWYYKEQAIKRIGAELANAITNKKWLETTTLIPIPPSKAPDDPLYDDRMTQVLHRIHPSADVRCLLRQKASREAAHLADVRPTPADLRHNYEIDESLTDPAPTSLGLFDDVLTSGTHFRACSDVLSARFPGVRILGIFVARRVFADDDKIV